MPANQKAQLINSCASLLSQMTKTQTELYGAERLKRMEQALIETLKTMDLKIYEQFMVAYSELYEKGDIC